jgi:hypothetical protein
MARNGLATLARAVDGRAGCRQRASEPDRVAQLVAARAKAVVDATTAHVERERCDELVGSITPQASRCRRNNKRWARSPPHRTVLREQRVRGILRRRLIVRQPALPCRVLASGDLGGEAVLDAFGTKHGGNSAERKPARSC